MPRRTQRQFIAREIPNTPQERKTEMRRATVVILQCFVLNETFAEEDRADVVVSRFRKRSRRRIAHRHLPAIIGRHLAARLSTRDAECGLRAHVSKGSRTDRKEHAQAMILRL